MNPILQSVQIALQNGTQAEAIAFVNKVYEFTASGKYAEVLSGWEPEAVKLLISYHMAKGTFLYTQSSEGEITGVLMWYNCNYEDGWDFVTEWEPDKPDGDSIFMAFLWSSNTPDFKKIVINLIAAEPNVLVKRLTGLRTKSNRPTKMDYSTKLFAKILNLKG